MRDDRQGWRPAWLGIGLDVLGITVLSYYAELHWPGIAPLFRYLYLIPIIHAAMSFGLGASMGVALLAITLFAPLMAVALRQQGLMARPTVEIWVTMLLLPALAYLVGRGWGRLNQQRSLYLGLSRLSDLFGQPLSREQLLAAMVDQGCQLLGAAGGEIVLEEGAELHTVVLRGLDEGPARERPGSLARWLLARGRPWIAGPLEELPSFERVAPGSSVESALAVPLRHEGRPVGLLAFYNARDGFTSDDLVVAEAIASKVEVALEGQRAVQQQAERERLQRELELAREVQQRFLPRAAPEIPGYEVAGLSLSAREVGGDFYLYVPLPDGRWCFAVGDVSGKGMAGAFYMAIATNLVEVQARELADGTPVLPLLNATLSRRLAGQHVNTALAHALLEPTSGRARLGNAGLIAPLHYQQATRSCRYLELAGLPLGAWEAACYEELALALAPGDMLVLVSDGVVETWDERRELFGLERLRALVEAQAGSGPPVLAQHILAAARSFGGAVEPHDDMTVMVLRRVCS